MKLITGAGLPILEYTRAELDEGLELAAVLVAFGFAKSKSEARRLITQGAVTLSSIPTSPKSETTS